MGRGRYRRRTFYRVVGAHGESSTMVADARRRCTVAARPARVVSSGYIAGARDTWRIHTDFPIFLCQCGSSKSISV